MVLREGGEGEWGVRIKHGQGEGKAMTLSLCASHYSLQDFEYEKKTSPL